MEGGRREGEKREEIGRRRVQRGSWKDREERGRRRVTEGEG